MRWWHVTRWTLCVVELIIPSTFTKRKRFGVKLIRCSHWLILSYPQLRCCLTRPCDSRPNLKRLALRGAYCRNLAPSLRRLYSYNTIPSPNNPALIPRIPRSSRLLIRSEIAGKPLAISRDAPTKSQTPHTYRGWVSQPSILENIKKKIGETGIQGFVANSPT